MSLLVTGGLGAGIGVGVLIMVAGATGRDVLGPRLPGRPGRAWRSRQEVPLRRRALARLGTAVGAGLLVLVVTGWPAAAVVAVVGVAVLPRVLGGRAARDAAIARTEAIASWCEMVRDSIVAASGLEEAICATGPVAPDPIATEVRALQERLQHQNLPLADALEAFGAEVEHPSADLVVAALATAARMEVSDLAGLLSRLADAIRDDARMRVRVEVGRTRVRTAAKVIVTVVAATSAVLTVASRDYLDAYDSAAGQAMLLAVASLFALGAWLLDRMATVQLPERFRGPATDAAGSRVDGGMRW